MKVFISHKKEDSLEASKVAIYLKAHSVESYLDVMENITIDDPKALTEHLKSRMHECSDLLVVLSNKTWESWWVPFEIGMAAEKDFPMVSYMKDLIKPPEYLQYYPALKSYSDISKYVQKSTSRINEASSFEKYGGSLNEAVNFSKRASITEKFYRDLKAVL